VDDVLRVHRLAGVEPDALPEREGVDGGVRADGPPVHQHRLDREVLAEGDQHLVYVQQRDPADVVGRHVQVDVRGVAVQRHPELAALGPGRARDHPSQQHHPERETERLADSVHRELLSGVVSGPSVQEPGGIRKARLAASRVLVYRAGHGGAHRRPRRPVRDRPALGLDRGPDGVQRPAGLSIGVVHDQALVWERGFGWASVERKAAAAPETLYRIASITKLFTATAILQLRDAGKLGLDEPLAARLPWFGLKGAEPGAPTITIRHLLTHTS